MQIGYSEEEEWRGEERRGEETVGEERRGKERVESLLQLLNHINSCSHISFIIKINDIDVIDFYHVGAPSQLPFDSPCPAHPYPP